jgi:hypothetical protein
MKRLLFMLPVLALLGCPLLEDTYRVYYDSPNSTEGKVPVDNKDYKDGATATVLGQGTLKRKVPGGSEDYYSFLGWRLVDYPYTLFKSEDKVTINRNDINLLAVWDDDSRFLFEVENGGITITGLKTSGSTYLRTVVIPDSLQGKNVTVIGDTAFSNSSITELTLPKHLEHIGAGAFLGNRIETITIPDSVETIGTGAFRDNSLTRVIFGNGLTTLESQTFYNNKLVNIDIPPDITTVKTSAFAQNDIVFIRLGANVNIQGEDVFGTYSEAFRATYNVGKTAGLYYYNDAAKTWGK